VNRLSLVTNLRRLRNVVYRGDRVRKKNIDEISLRWNKFDD